MTEVAIRNNVDNMDTKILELESNVRLAHNLGSAKSVLGQLLEISREIPDNANNLDSNMAEYLSGKFLKALDMCGEIYSMAVSYEMKMENLRKKEFSTAMIIRAVEDGIRTAKEREVYAYSDDKYLEAADNHALSKMFRLMIEEKKEAFSKAHYLMRKILDRTATISDVRVISNSSDSANNTKDEWIAHSTWLK